MGFRDGARNPRSWRPGLLWVAIFAVGAVTALVATGASVWTAQFTDTTEFCVSCHSMATPHREYQRSAHFSNASGVRVECHQCHVPKQPGPFVWAKIRAARDLYGEVMGFIDTPEEYEARRLELAERVWARFEETDSRECRDCHSFDAMTIAKQSTAEARNQHTKAKANGETCISCHKGLVHTMPDMGPITQIARDELHKTLGQIPAESKTVRLVATEAYFLTPGDEDSRGGRILPGIALPVIGRDNDMVQVKLSGWRQEGADNVLYLEAGKRILVASLGANAREALTASGDSVTIAETNQTWSPASLEVWVPSANLTADTDRLWGYASSLYAVNCAMCHAAPHLNEYDANGWLGQFKAMVESTTLEKQDRALVQTWLQTHASDMAPH